MSNYRIWVDDTPLDSIGFPSKLVLKYGRNGCTEATWSMALGRDERPRCLTRDEPFVRIDYGAGLPWSGKLDAPDWNAGTFAAIGSAREAEGAQCLTAAGAVTSKPNTAIDAAITRGKLPNWVRVGDFGINDLAGPESDDSTDDPDIESVADLLNMWAFENDSQWYLHPDRRLVIRPEDESDPKWFVLPSTVVLGVAADEKTGRVFLRYRSTPLLGRVRTASYPATSPANGVERLASIVKRGSMFESRAIAIATAMYRRLGAGGTGWTNGIDAHHGQILTKGGLVADLSQIRGGDTVCLLGHRDPRTGAPNTNVVIDTVEHMTEEHRIQLNPVNMANRTWESVMKQSRAERAVDEFHFRGI